MKLGVFAGDFTVGGSEERIISAEMGEDFATAEIDIDTIYEKGKCLLVSSPKAVNFRYGTFKSVLQNSWCSCYDFNTT